MSSAEPTTTGPVSALRRVGAGPRRAGAWFGALGLAAVLPVLPLWLFCSDPELRRTAILVALDCALACLGGIALFQCAAGGRRPYAEVAVAEFSATAEPGGPGATGPDQPPSVLPSRRGMQARSLVWYFGVCTVLVSLLALVMGAPQRPERMQRIVDAGAEFANVPVEKVSDVRLHDPSKGHDYYTSTVVVRLAPGPGVEGDPVTARVHPVTPDRPHAGGKLSVLYAPARPALGALAGDEHSLGDALEGSTMTTGRTWIVGIAWAAGIVLSVIGLSLRHGFRSFSRLGGADMAVRGTCRGAGFWQRDSRKEQCLKIVTASSRTAHFLVPVTEHQVPASLKGQHLWLCWEAPRGAENGQSAAGGTAAALVSDDGWVMHGKLKADDARMMAAEGVSVDKAAAGHGESRGLRLWNPQAAWPLYLAPSALALAAALIGCAALLTLDITGTWRWVIGLAGAVIGLALAYAAMKAPYLSNAGDPEAAS
ncbi:hypothetical protein ACFW81_29830 [Streptomyces angustmyceticus]|uniref:hypothetical protein n=1 Tax=Streptomyces angustmyceticus TaxID=285578 RepID=UPI00369B7D90